MIIYIYIYYHFYLCCFFFYDEENNLEWNVYTIDHLYIYDGYLSWELLEWICFMDIQYSMSRILNE